MDVHDGAKCRWCGGRAGEDEEICEDCRLKAIREEERQSEADERFLEGEIARLEELEERLVRLREQDEEGVTVCPRCFTEYQSHADRCSECAVDLVSQESALETLGAEMDRLREELRRGGRRNWIGVYQHPDVFSVIAVVRRLEGAGLPVMVRSAGFDGSVLEALFPGTPNVRRYRQSVMVPLDREGEARAVIETWRLAGGSAEGIDRKGLEGYLASLDPDPNRRLVHCPSCLRAYERPRTRCEQCGYDPLLLAEELGAMLRNLGREDGDEDR